MRWQLATACQQEGLSCCTLTGQHARLKPLPPHAPSPATTPHMPPMLSPATPSGAPPKPQPAGERPSQPAGRQVGSLVELKQTKAGQAAGTSDGEVAAGASRPSGQAVQRPSNLPCQTLLQTCSTIARTYSKAAAGPHAQAGAFALELAGPHACRRRCC